MDPPIRAVDGQDQYFDPIFLPTWDTFVLGDFNAHSPTWDSNCPEDLSGEELDDWAILGDLVALNDGSPTRVSSRGVATAPDVTFVPSTWEQHLIWHTGIHIGSDHFPIIIEFSGDIHPPAKLGEGYILLIGLIGGPISILLKADWSTFQETLDSTLSVWNNHFPTYVHRANALLSSVVALAAKKAIPKGSRKTQCAWWCLEVEQAVTPLQK